MQTEYESKVPSQSIELLAGLIGKRIVKLIRYSWWPKEEVLNECDLEDYLEFCAEKVFSLTAGPLALVLDDGSIVGLGSDPKLCSVIVWQEQSADGQKLKEEPLDEDNEIFPILNDDWQYAGVFWHTLSDLKITAISLLKKRIMSASEKARPSEHGLRFTLDTGVQFLASHGLHDDSDDFSVLENEQVRIGDNLDVTVLAGVDYPNRPLRDGETAQKYRFEYR